MKVYKDGKTMNADKDQMEIVLDAGWSKIKPEDQIEEEKQVNPEAADEVNDVDVKDEAAEVKQPKKLRKILKKKK